MNSDETLGEEIATLAAQLEAGEYRLITKIGAFDAQGGYAREGALSCAHWLSYRVGLGLGPAREKVRVARALPKFPLIAKAFEAARVSYSKVRAITRVATPENEAMLVDLATSAPASVLETLCRRFRGVLEAERETPPEADERRTVAVHHTDDGRLRLSVELDADEGARLLAALDLARFDVSAETPRSFDVPAEAPRTRADALMVLVESFLAEGPRARAGGIPTEVLLHVTEDELQSGGGFIENSGCIGVSAEASRRLACDSAVVEVIEASAGRVLRTGRRARTVPMGMRRALEVRDQRRCAFPSCTHTRFLDAHHVQHWADGGATELDNLVLLCRRHHTFVRSGRGSPKTGPSSESRTWPDAPRRRDLSALRGDAGGIGRTSVRGAGVGSGGVSFGCVGEAGVGSSSTGGPRGQGRTQHHRALQVRHGCLPQEGVISPDHALLAAPPRVARCPQPRSAGGARRLCLRQRLQARPGLSGRELRGAELQQGRRVPG